MAAGPWTLNDRIVPQKIFKRRPANIGLLNHLTIRSFNQNHLLPEVFNFDIDVHCTRIFGEGAYLMPSPSRFLCENKNIRTVYKENA